MITWEKQRSGGYITEIGDLRIILKEYDAHWWLSMGIRSYSADMVQSMMRPPVNIIQFKKPCDDMKAMSLANEYMEKFINGIVSNFS